jgi:hypothetical protein
MVGQKENEEGQRENVRSSDQKNFVYLVRQATEKSVESQQISQQEETH